MTLKSSSVPGRDASMTSARFLAFEAVMKRGATRPSTIVTAAIATRAVMLTFAMSAMAKPTRMPASAEMMTMPQ